MKKLNSPIILSILVISISFIGIVSALQVQNGTIGGLFFKYSADNGYDWNLQQFTSSGYRLDGRNIHTDFGGKDLTTTGNINNVNTVNANVLHIKGGLNGDIWIDGSRLDSTDIIHIGEGLVGGQTAKNTVFGGDITVKGGNIDMLKGQTSNIYHLGLLSFDWTTGGVYNNSSFHGIESKDEAGTFSGSIRINSYGDIINTIDSNSNSISKFKVQKESSGNGVDLLTVDEAGNTTIAGKVTSLATVSSDGINTLTTKSYVDKIIAISSACNAINIGSQNQWGDKCVDLGAYTSVIPLLATNNNDASTNKRYFSVSFTQSLIRVHHFKPGILYRIETIQHQVYAPVGSVHDYIMVYTMGVGNSGMVPQSGMLRLGSPLYVYIY